MGCIITKLQKVDAHAQNINAEAYTLVLKGTFAGCVSEIANLTLSRDDMERVASAINAAIIDYDKTLESQGQVQ
jgi:hypothetical protein